MKIKILITILSLAITQINCMEAPESELSDVPSLVFSAALQLAKNGQIITIDQVGDENLVLLAKTVRSIFYCTILTQKEKQFLLALINNPNKDMSILT